jgi:uncharacterized integral membrane protein
MIMLLFKDEFYSAITSSSYPREMLFIVSVVTVVYFIITWLFAMVILRNNPSQKKPQRDKRFIAWVVIGVAILAMCIIFSIVLNNQESLKYSLLPFEASVAAITVFITITAVGEKIGYFNKEKPSASDTEPLDLNK